MNASIRRLSIAVAAVLVLASHVPALAQSRTAVGIGEAFTAGITAAKDGETNRILVYLDGKPLGAPVAALPGAETLVPVQGLTTPGAHVIEATAWNDHGESLTRFRLPFWVGPPPAPTGRILVTTTTEAEFAPEVTPEGISMRLIRTASDVTVTPIK